MTDDATSALNRLKARKENLLKVHGPRNPMDAKITQLIEEYNSISRDDEIIYSQSHLELCDLYLAKSEVLLALSSLAEASIHHSEKSAKKAAEIMSRISTKKYTRSIKKFSAAEVRDAVAKIIDACETGFNKNKLQIYYYVFANDTNKALLFVGKNIVDNPKSGVPDFIRLARMLSQRKNFLKMLPALGKVINTHFQEIIDYGGRPLVQELEEKFRHDEDARNALALKAEYSTSFHDFVVDSTFHELINFINNSEAFLFADGTEEEDKNFLVDEFKRRVFEDDDLNYKLLFGLLQKASCTHRFWQSSEWRGDFLALLKSKFANSPDHYALTGLGVIAFLNGSDAEAKTHFSRSIEGDSPFSATGATSFLSDVTHTSLSSKLLSLSDIMKSDSAFRERAIITCSDEIYFKRYAIKYLQSLRNTGSTCPVHFHIAGNKIRLKEFVSTIVDLGEVSFSYETPIERTPAYYASIRFLKAPYFVEKVAARVLLTDIDVTFRSDPDELLDQCVASNSDIMLRIYDKIRIVHQASMPQRPLYRYPRTYPWAQVNAACLCLTNTEMGKLAAEQIAQDMAGHLGSVLSRGKRAWWVDQNALLFTYRRLLANEAVKIGNIEDVGVPFGSFDYSDLRVVGGENPALSPRAR